MKKIFFGLLALFALAMLVKHLGSDKPLLQMGSVKLINPYTPGSPLYADHQVFVDRFNANEKLAERYSDVISSKGLYAAWQSALRQGAHSLPGERLIAVARSQVAILPRMSEQGCAKLLRPRDDFDEALGADIRQAVEQLPPRHHKAMTEFFYDSLVAEMDGRPVITVDEASFNGAAQALAQRYPGEYGQRLVRVMGNPSGVSDEDACWALNTLLHTATQLPEDHAEAFLRRTLGG